LTLLTSVTYHEGMTQTLDFPATATITAKGVFHRPRRKEGFLTVTACGQRLMRSRGGAWSNGCYLYEDGKQVTCWQCKRVEAAGK
jgi:hypothetical protein